jgi:hypothetical protein
MTYKATAITHTEQSITDILLVYKPRAPCYTHHTDYRLYQGSSNCNYADKRRTERQRYLCQLAERGYGEIYSGYPEQCCRPTSITFQLTQGLKKGIHRYLPLWSTIL